MSNESFFEVVNCYKNNNIQIPKRQTKYSAGYDLAAAIETKILPQQLAIIPTGLKVFLPYNQVLLIYSRSSLFIKKKLMLTNNVGVIDSDYYNNSENEGHILISLYNFSNQTVIIDKNERIAQGIFQNFLLTKNDNNESKIRKNGFGSTKKF
ncbi:MAG: dUTP diphosphatase [Pigeon pea little leaf phytoplasma]|uniref:dUTP diphosphatase n=1 Tax=Candidatus Phytoplasma fabacearum TaxID=2982628 RepID=A0ABU8ZS89_9MOLU|nr:dUTP diphosphatase ['Bituminaria bituminosa' little leaf phytoplasma]MDV3148796.1 dUTP diphosphatase [Pigeon pea little leaf phytoplasma]MDO7983481.1 dUTP diphosphatase ['Bituminaria bituminosa' little leaf phytoplasma]MDO8023892.1 dUTP diphosphatase ['Bituminaria bituminosa' little leaf phytoplasma]MDO8030497.1 dUTP diphosphatase ['Bituminaria bituminosa' little leaf phytoplasma]MDV3154011.1 dUTP diphosphatase [Pigeon pea little leaf phytoplasma]